jgi:hypothetical protein
VSRELADGASVKGASVVDSEVRAIWKSSNLEEVTMVATLNTFLAECHLVPVRIDFTVIVPDFED